MGSPAWMMPAGSSTTTMAPAVAASTRPIALSASSGSMRASRSSAGPRRTTRPIAVPSSSVKPSGSQVDHQPADPHEPADPRIEVDEVGVGCGWWRASGAPVVAGLAVPALEPVAERGVGIGAARDANVGRGTGRDRVAPIRGARVGTPRDADHGRGPADRERRARDPGPWLPDDHDLGRADLDLGPPAVTELGGADHPAGHRHEPPLLRRARRTVEGRRGRHGPVARDDELVGPKTRGTVGDADPTLGADLRARPRAQASRSAAGSPRRPTSPARRSAARWHRAGWPAPSRSPRSRPCGP